MLQRTDEWHQARLGKATSSRMGDVTARTKTGYGASREGYMGELVAERLTGQPYPTYQSAAMLRGTEKESEGLETYALLTGQTLTEVGFVPHPHIKMSGASPDRLIGAHGAVEIKCPNTSTHIATIRGKAKIDRSYVVQVQFMLSCTGREWCDWVSYDDRLPARQSIYVKRLYRDEREISQLEHEVVRFLGEVDQAVADLEKMNDEQWLIEALRASCETA
jgi:hypothetical protein